MTRTLTFTPDDAPRFELLYTGFLQGGNTLHPNSRTRDERKKEAKILRALKAISVGEPTAIKRELLTSDASNASITLEQDQHDLLVQYVEACPFTTQVSDVVDDLIDWLRAAPSA